MVECQKCLDPTSYGLFLVAFVSLPLALACLLPGTDTGLNLVPILIVGGILILIVSFIAFYSESNFGFIVFGLVGLGVLLAGISGLSTGTDATGAATTLGGLGLFGAVTLAVVYLLSLVWSFIARTPKILTIILLTTALIFLFNGLFSYFPNDTIYQTLEGIVALLNFIFAVYLAFALALEDRLPVF